MSNRSVRIISAIMNLIHWFLLGCLIRCVINGQNNLFITIALCLYGLEIFLKIKKIFSKKDEYKNMCNQYQKMFENLKYIHKVRYGLYFSGDTEALQEVTQNFNECANDQLEIGKELLENPNFNQKEKDEIQKIIDQTKQLIENIQPPV